MNSNTVCMHMRLVSSKNRNFDTKSILIAVLFRVEKTACYWVFSDYVYVRKKYI